MARPRVLYAEDHRVVFQGIQRMLAPWYRVEGPVVDGREVVARVHARKPDILILDLDLPNRHGSEMIPELKQAYPRMPILVLTVQTSPAVMEHILGLGADGFVPKGADVKELRKALADVQAGKVHRSPKVVRTREVAAAHPHDALIAEFDATRLKVFQAIAEGFGTREVAQRAGISSWGVYYHRKAIKGALGLDSDRSLERAAADWRLRRHGVWVPESAKATPP